MSKLRFAIALLAASAAMVVMVHKATASQLFQIQDQHKLGYVEWQYTFSLGTTANYAAPSLTTHFTGSAYSPIVDVFGANDTPALSALTAAFMSNAPVYSTTTINGKDSLNWEPNWDDHGNPIPTPNSHLLSYSNISGTTITSYVVTTQLVGIGNVNSYWTHYVSVMGGFTAVPEPHSVSLMGLLGVIPLLMRRK